MILEVSSNLDGFVCVCDDGSMAVAVVPAVPCRPSRPLPPPPAARHWPAGGSAPLPAAAAAALPSAPPAPLPRPARSSRLGQERPRSESREPHVKKESTAKIHLQHILHHAGSSYVAWWTRPRLVPGISIRDHGWNSGKQANETCRRTGFHTKSPLSPVRRSRPLPSWGVSEFLRSHQPPLTSSTRSWMNRSKELEPLISLCASSSTVFACFRYSTTSSTLPSTAFARFLGKQRKQRVGMDNCMDWR